MRDLIFVGTLVHATKENPMDILFDALLVVKDGKICAVGKQSELNDAMDKYGISTENVHRLSPKEFLIPGFVDTHMHASQYVNAGTALDLPLLEWLRKYTFPTEAQYANEDFATFTYEKGVHRLLRNGTTCASYYATIHPESSLKLCEIISNAGQRAFVGKVNMNQNAPDYYIETTEESMEGTIKFLDGVKKMENPLIKAILTPRFAPCTDMGLMSQLANIARERSIPVQTHLSENKAEVAWIKSLFPNCNSYTDVYHCAGLLRTGTILAHCVYLEDDEIDLLKQNDCGVSHCPNSNLSLASGLCDVRRLLSRGVKVGLGTDCSGGYNCSMLDAIRNAAAVSKILKMSKGDGYKLLTHRDLFRLATLGGSELLCLENEIGNFEIGKQFDALKINTCVQDSPFDIFDADTTEDIIQKFIYLGDDRNITEVYVSGNLVRKRGLNAYGEIKSFVNGEKQSYVNGEIESCLHGGIENCVNGEIEAAP